MADSVEALNNESRAPPEVAFEIYELRKRYLLWGGKKPLKSLPRQIKEIFKFTSVSTANRVLKKQVSGNGLAHGSWRAASSVVSAKAILAIVEKNQNKPQRVFE